MSFRLACLMLAVLSPLSFPAGAEQALGRLFFTPEQRARMDMARQQERSIRIDMEQQEESSPPPSNIRLDGMLTRSDGKTTLWINNRVQSPDSRSAIVEKGGKVRVVAPEAGLSVPLKVGQSIDMGSGQVEEVYRRAPPAAAPGKADQPATAPGAAGAHPPPGRGDAPAETQGEGTPQP